ncbi:MAG: RNA-directed DNA polymerase, partial [Oceanospirillaceae bacterium]
MKIKTRKLKIQTNNKQYPLTDSVLYKLSNKNRLASLLNTTLPLLKKLLCDSNYRYFEDNSSGKPREIEHPLGQLEVIHTRLASLLCRVEQPDYVHSGIKNRSHVTNAKSHIGHFPVLATDIQSFFKKTTTLLVFKFFHQQLKCSSDIAKLLSQLCTCKGYIPTGSRISMP